MFKTTTNNISSVFFVCFDLCKFFVIFKFLLFTAESILLETFDVWSWRCWLLRMGQKNRNSASRFLFTCVWCYLVSQQIGFCGVDFWRIEFFGYFPNYLIQICISWLMSTSLTFPPHSSIQTEETKSCNNFGLTQQAFIPHLSLHASASVCQIQNQILARGHQLGPRLTVFCFIKMMQEKLFSPCPDIN